MRQRWVLQNNRGTIPQLHCGLENIVWREKKTFVEDNLGEGITQELSPIKTALNVTCHSFTGIHTGEYAVLCSSSSLAILASNWAAPTWTGFYNKRSVLKKVVVSCNTGQSVSEMTFLVPFKDSDSKAGQAFYLCDSPGIFLLLRHYKVIKIEPKLKRTEPKFRRRNILYSPIGPL